MTTPAELVQALSDTTGVPLATVVDIDRKLVAAGLRTKGGRGLNAARMSTLDAARVLTAILASPQANQSSAAVERYTSTYPDTHRSSDGLFAGAGFKGLAALPARHSFVDALTAVIESAATGALRELLDAGNDEHFPRIEVFALTRATYGRIRISGLPSGVVANVEYVPAASSKRGRGKAADVQGDLEESRRVTERTIISIAKVLVKESGNGRA